MSVGLNDLNKKRKIHQPSVIRSQTRPSDQSSAESVRNLTTQSAARPWSESNFAKAPTRSRPRVSHRDLAVNDEWMSLQTEPIFWIDFQQHSFLLKLNEQLCALESKVDTLVLSPLRAIRAFLQPRSSNQA